ncbi:hypothetical protein [Paraburkholderia youngii]|uniref:hypothetical protein n=1 Tax=Paraburkholderia youngii TaxID=2782701 RepID=UPI003D255F40
MQTYWIDNRIKLRMSILSPAKNAERLLKKWEPGTLTGTREYAGSASLGRAHLLKVRVQAGRLFRQCFDLAHALPLRIDGARARVKCLYGASSSACGPTTRQPSGLSGWSLSTITQKFSVSPGQATHLRA